MYCTLYCALSSDRPYGDTYVVVKGRSIFISKVKGKREEEDEGYLSGLFCVMVNLNITSIYCLLRTLYEYEIKQQIDFKFN